MIDSVEPAHCTTEIDRPIDAVVALVARTLTMLAAVSEGESGRELGRRLGALEQIDRMVEGSIAAVVAHADRTEAYADDGHVSVRNWVMAVTNQPAAEATHRARTSALVDTSPGVGDELRAGRLGVAQVRELARVRANPRVGERVDAVIDELLEEARSTPVHGFIRTVRAWEALVDQDGSHRDHEAAHAGRRVSVHRLDAAGGELRGTFGSAQLAEIAEIIDRYAEAEFAAEWDALRAEHGDDACPALLARSEAQRRADALVRALRDGAASRAPGGDGPAPTVNVIVPLDVFEEQLRAVVDQRPPLFETGSTRRRLCVTADGTPLDPLEALAAAFAGHVRRIVIDGAGRIVDVGRRRRLFTGAAREAALLQAVLDGTDGRCLWPGCGRRRRCQVDHLHEWQHDGMTDLVNVGWLCASHNRFKSYGYSVVRDDDGHWHMYRPDGTELGIAA